MRVLLGQLILLQNNKGLAALKTLKQSIVLNHSSLALFIRLKEFKHFDPLFHRVISFFSTAQTLHLT